MSSASVHILVIDDDEVFRRLIGAKLAAAGFEVLYASRGHEGREIARRMHPDMILLDIRMPEEDGLSMARRLKTERQTQDIPVVLLTNEDLSLEAEKNVKELGVADYIHKSIDPDEFIERIKKDLQTERVANQDPKKPGV